MHREEAAERASLVTLFDRKRRTWQIEKRDASLEANQKRRAVVATRKLERVWARTDWRPRSGLERRSVDARSFFAFGRRPSRMARTRSWRSVGRSWKNIRQRRRRKDRRSKPLWTLRWWSDDGEWGDLLTSRKSRRRRRARIRYRSQGRMEGRVRKLPS